MPTEVILPKVDMDMTQGTIATWHVAEGGGVEKGAPLFDIETDKAAMEVEAPASGTLHHPVPEGSVVAIGAPVAWIYAAGEAVGAAPTVTPPAPSGARPPDAPPPDAPPPEPVPKAGPAETPGTRATPKARHAARAAGVDLSGVTGSGPLGRIQFADIAPPARPQDKPAQTGALHVTSLGKGTGTPLVLIHGFGDDSQTWAPLLAALPKGHPHHRIDLPGHGKSPRRVPADFAGLVRELREAFDALKLERAHVIGHSLGGALALALADTRARNIASLTLIAPAGLGPEIDGAILNGIARASRPESLAPWLRQLLANPDTVTDAYARLAFAARSDPALRDAQGAMADSLFADATQTMDLIAALHRLTCPTRLIWGRNDRVIPWRHALRAPGRVALHLFDNTGHVPHLERPGEIASVLASGL